MPSPVPQAPGKVLFGLRSRLLALLLVAIACPMALVAVGGVQHRTSALAAAGAHALSLARDAAADQERLLAQMRQLTAEFGRRAAARGVEDCAAFGALLKAAQPWVTNLHVANPDGTLVCSTVPQPWPSFGDRAYFQEAVATGRGTTSDFLIGRPSGKPLIAVAEPVAAPTGGDLYAIGGLSLAWAEQQGARVTELPGALFLALDRHGTVMARLPQGPVQIGDAYGDHPFAKAALAIGAGTLDMPTLDSVRRVAGVATISGPGTVIVVAFDRARILATADAALRRDLMLTALAGLLAAVLAWFGLEAWVTRPVRAMVETAQRIAGGDFAARTGVSGRDEVAVLAGSLDRMAEGLARRDREIAERGRLLSAVFESAADPFFITRVETNGIFVIEAVNAAAAAFLGLSTEEVEGRRLADLVPLDMLVMVEADFAALRKLGGAQRFERVRDHGGMRQVWDNVQVPFFDEEGRLLRVFGTMRDVTLERSHARELAEAKVVAEAANAAKSAFLAHMSHELRTPLTGVIGFAGLLLKAPLEPEPHRYAARIEEAGRTLLAIVDDVLDLSRVEAGKLDLDMAPTDLPALIEGCAALLAPWAEEKALALEVDIDPFVPAWVLADPVRLRQVLLNLLSNAVKFTEAGSVNLRVRYGGEEQGGHRLAFEIIDTGIGLGPLEIQRLFEPFAQGDPSTARRYGGTGLGLVITKGLVGLMGGTVSVDSKKGQGSTFRVELRLTATEMPVIPPTPTAISPRPLRVLLAEDQPMNQELVRGILGHAGHEVEVVGDGAAAVAAARQGGFDLLLMDMQMPVMDGLVATRAIRRLRGPAGRMPIVGLTANALPEQIDRCLQAGMDEVVTKPIRAEVLLAAVARREATGGPPPPSRDRASPVFDADLFARARAAAGAAVVDDMARILLDELAQRLARMRAEDPAEAGRAAHELVSLAGSLGLRRGSAACRAVMEAGQRGDAQALAAVRLEAENALVEGAAELRRVLAGRGDGDRADPVGGG